MLLACAVAGSGLTRGPTRRVVIEDLRCELCQGPEGDLEPRLYHCKAPEVVAARAAAEVPDDFQQRARAALAEGGSAARALYLRLTVVNPCEAVPAPAESSRVRARDAQGAELSSGECIGLERLWQRFLRWELLAPSVC